MKNMSKKIIAMIVVGVILAGAVGFGGYKFYKFQIKMRNNISVINEFLNVTFKSEVDAYVQKKMGVPVAPAPVVAPEPLPISPAKE